MRRARGIAMGTLALAVMAIMTMKSVQPPAVAGNEAAAEDQAPRTTIPSLPIHRVALFSSGVGYFEREGEVEGNTRIDLSFPFEDINDLLKSMVVYDLDGGLVSAVSYDSLTPPSRTLESLTINLSEEVSLVSMLKQARGQKIEITFQPNNPRQSGNITGTILVLDERRPPGKESADTWILNLWCADGVHSVPLPDIQTIHFLNPTVERDVQRALRILSETHDSQKKVVSLIFTGKGKRRVRVGYILENPIWKTSYRLVLGKQEKALLQGWAVVENETEEDWNPINLALISGRPISFQMNLYQSFYVPRPVVVPELYSSLVPQTYELGRPPAGAGIAMGAQIEDEPTQLFRRTLAESTPGKQPGGFGALGGSGGLGGNLAAGTSELQKQMAELATAAQGAEVGHAFRYTIEKPVSLPRHKSALFPILNQAVQCSRVSVYDEAVNVKFPLHGVRLKNTSGLHLMQGPITVFDGDQYAGDARILDVQPQEERLLSFAVDLGLEVEPKPQEARRDLMAVKIHKGVASVGHRNRQAITYHATNRSGHERTLLIEHSVHPGFRLADKDPRIEQTRAAYRIEVKVPADKPARREVVEEQDVVEDVVLAKCDDKDLRLYRNSPAVAPAVKEALDQIMRRRNQWAGALKEMTLWQAQWNALQEDQARLRANLKEMPAAAAAYKRYLEKFDRQETEIEAMQARYKELQAKEQKERNAYDAFLASVTAE